MMKLAAAAALLLAPVAAVAQTAPAPATPAPAAAPAMAPVIYDKALAPGWQNWSWAKTELSVESAGARKPIMVDAQGYQALALHHAPFDTTPFRGVSMLIQSVGGEAQVRLIALVGGQPIPDGTNMGADGKPQPKMKIISLKPGGWTQVQVPLRDLGAEKTTIDGFWVQNNSGQPAPHFYVADVKLIQ